MRKPFILLVDFLFNVSERKKAIDVRFYELGS